MYRKYTAYRMCANEIVAAVSSGAEPSRPLRALLLPLVLFLLGILSAPPASADEADELYSKAYRAYAAQNWNAAATAFTQFLEEASGHKHTPVAHFYLAETRLHLQQRAIAKRLYQDFLETYPEHTYEPYVHFRLGEALLLDGQFVAAEQQLASLADTEYRFSALVNIYLAKLHLQQNAHAKARAYFERTITRFPKSPQQGDALLGLAILVDRSGDKAAARQQFEAILQGPYRHVHDDALLELGASLIEAGQYAAGKELLDRLLREHTNSSLAGQARLWLGKIAWYQERWSDAVSSFEKSAQQHAREPIAADMLFYGGAAAAKLGDTDRSQLLYRQLLQRWPQHARADDAYFNSILAAKNMAVVAQQSSAPAAVLQAIEDFQRRYAASPLLPAIQKLQGELLLRTNQFEQALVCFDACQAHESPENVDALEVQYYRATCLIGLERYTEAHQDLQSIMANGGLANQRLQPSLHLSLGQALLLDGHYQESLKALQRVKPDSAQGATAVKLQVIACARLQKLADAEEIIAQQLVDSGPDNLMCAAWLALAEAFVASGKRADGFAYYERLAAKDVPAKFQEKALVALAWLSAADGKKQASEQYLQQFTKQFPGSGSQPRALMIQAEAMERADRMTPALHVYRRVYEEFGDSPQAPQAMFAAALIHVQLKQHVEAQELFAKTHERFPAHPSIDALLYQWAWTLHELDLVDDSNQKFQQLVTEHSTSKYWCDACYRLAESAVRQRQYETAHSLLTPLLQHPELSADTRQHALYLQGQTFVSEQRWQEAMAALQLLLADYKDSPLTGPATYWIAESLFQQNEYVKATPYFEKLAKSAAPEQTWRNTARLRLAQSMAHRKEWKAAIETADDLVQKHPTFPQRFEANYLAGRCLAAQGKFTLARERFRHVIQDPLANGTETAALAQWMIGESHMHQKDYETALRAYQRVVNLFPHPRWQAAALLQSGKCLEARGDLRDAYETYSRVVQKYKDSEFAQQAQMRLQVANKQMTIR